MSRRPWLLALAVLAVASCAPRGSTELTADEREDALAMSAHAPRRFTFERTLGTPLYRIDGEVEDDYRYRATFSLGDREVYEEVDIDDRRVLQVRDASALPEAARTDPKLAPLLSGAWVSDSANAPTEFVKADAQARLLDPAVVLDKVRYMEKTQQERTRLQRLRAATRHDPKSTRYLRRNDKFPAYPEDGIRYDIVPPSYDGDLLFRNGIPDDLAESLESSVLYLSYWVKDGRMTRIELFFDVDVKAVEADIRDAAERQANRSGIATSAITTPPVPQPYRETYTFSYPKEPVRLTLPTPTGTVALPPLATLLGGSPS